MFVTLEKIRVHASATAQEADGGWTDIAVSPRRRIDLLTLTNGALEELGTAQLPAGRYQQLRLVLAANEPGAGAMANSVLPSGATQEQPLVLGQGGIKVAAAIDVSSGSTADAVLDFDACRSVAASAGSYHLKPVISVLPRRSSGIEGTVAAALATSNTTVSAQRDGVAVRSTRPDASGKFRIPYLEPGSYALVIAADGHATGVITDVPVQDGATNVSQDAGAISLPRSSTKEISGAVTLSMEDDPAGTAPAALTEGLARAAQELAGGASLEVRVRPLDAATGAYRLTVPTAHPVRAAYTPSGPLAFRPDATDAGRYSVDVLVPGD